MKIQSNLIQDIFINILFLNLFITEFLLGETILVAPVLVEHATTRDIYLPAGLWRDENHPNFPPITGRVWLFKYSATLEVLPWFTKIGDHPSPKPSGSTIIISSVNYTLALTLIVYLFYT